MAQRFRVEQFIRLFLIFFALSTCSLKAEYINLQCIEGDCSIPFFAQEDDFAKVLSNQNSPELDFAKDSVNNLSLSGTNIADGTITGAKIAEANIENKHIKDIDASKITTGTINSERLPARNIADVSGLQSSLDTKLTSSDLDPYAKKTDLTEYTKTTDLNNYSGLKT